MSLTIFNGSPRRTGSNTALIAESFAAGFNAPDTAIVPLGFLADDVAWQEAWDTSDTVVLAFPLYTDAMPGLVKEFIENLTAYVKNSGKAAGKRLAFIVQSGFPEGIHSLAVKRYLEKWAGRLGADYVGTLIKGGVEGMQEMPAYGRQILKAFHAQGAALAAAGAFDNKLADKMKAPLRIGGVRRILFALLTKTGLLDRYWDMELKKNGAYDRRRAKPYSA